MHVDPCNDPVRGLIPLRPMRLSRDVCGDCRRGRRDRADPSGVRDHAGAPDDELLPGSAAATWTSRTRTNVDQTTGRGRPTSWSCLATRRCRSLARRRFATSLRVHDLVRCAIRRVRRRSWTRQCGRCTVTELLHAPRWSLLDADRRCRPGVPRRDGWTTTRTRTRRSPGASLNGSAGAGLASRFARQPRTAGSSKKPGAEGGMV